MAPSVADAVRFAGGWLFDQVMDGWDVTVLTADHADPRPARILGARTHDLDDALSRPVWGPCVQSIAVRAELYGGDPRVRRMVLTTLDGGMSEVRLWGEGCPEDVGAAGPWHHRLSVAARAFKAQALAAADIPADPGEVTEVFRLGLAGRPSLIPVETAHA